MPRAGAVQDQVVEPAFMGVMRFPAPPCRQRNLRYSNRVQARGNTMMQSIAAHTVADGEAWVEKERRFTWVFSTAHQAM
jgi:hypothetical protein